MKRCCWAELSELMIAYHDHEWGVPVHNDRKLFEHLVLDAFQAGLSWAIILHKRKNFRKAFANFDPEKIARYTRRDIERLLADPGIVRNKQKVEAAVTNARAFLRIQDRFGSFDAFVWQFVGGSPRHNSWKTIRRVPAKTRESDRMSEALREQGFAFAGSTVCYAFMQAAGMVNDHLVSCFRHAEIRALHPERRPS
ncbi:MAG: DNA-3-methyladenine glycosylase I, DNA-3-methyladenine glycosylase I [candidate division NC10 bacterium CSP1-5]|nr:MAG: DNA-3-methyladenine glycosylase I, DNA-3-methyladenine glycosylase I [candidate division NC10 bacterium CSP1-5]